jgi:hypothetical protein
MTRNLDHGFGMGLDVVLADVMLTLVPPPPFSPGFASTVLVKSPSPYLSFHAPFLASQCPTITVPRVPHPRALPWSGLDQSPNLGHEHLTGYNSYVESSSAPHHYNQSSVAGTNHVQLSL